MFSSSLSSSSSYVFIIIIIIFKKAYMPAWSFNCTRANGIHADLMQYYHDLNGHEEDYHDLFDYHDLIDDDDDDLTFLPTRSAARLLVKPITAAFVVP